MWTSSRTGFLGTIFQGLGEAEDDEICHQISLFQNISGARGLVGWMLKPLAHRRIANATGDFWPLTNMKFNNAADTPRFTLDRDSPVQDNVRFIKVKRDFFKLQSIADLSTCLNHNAYYVPMDPNFPLFDAFTVEIDVEKGFAVLWILQMTMSRTHEGSTLGYRQIREIIAILKDKLQEGPPLKRRKTAGGQATSTPLVEVRYLLVVPKDESQSQNLQWQFPKGWSQNRKRNDHSGNVYRLEVPLAVYVLPLSRMYRVLNMLLSDVLGNARCLSLSAHSTCPIMVFFLV